MHVLQCVDKELATVRTQRPKIPNKFAQTKSFNHETGGPVPADPKRRTDTITKTTALNSISFPHTWRCVTEYEYSAVHSSRDVMRSNVGSRVRRKPDGSSRVLPPFR